jgi:glycosyltransferase involved in cell wall biosynthesis
VRAKGVDPARMHLVNVWSDPNEIRVLPRSENPYRAEWSIGERFVVQYSGNFGIGHDMTAMCDAMRRLAGDDRIRWVMVGGGVRKKEVERAISEGGIPNAVVAAHQPRARLGELLALGDAHLVTIAPGFEGTLVPSKFYGVLAAAKPTLYVGPATSEVARTVDERRAGVAVAVGDGKALAEAILAMVEDRAEALAMGERGRRATEQELGIAFACAKWRAILADVVAGRRRN